MLFVVACAPACGAPDCLWLGIVESILVGVCGDCVLPYPCVCGSTAFLVVESRPSVLEPVKTTETIESLSQQDLLYKNLENYAVNQRGK